MADLKDKIDELAQLMDEFGLDESRMSGPDWCVEFARRPKTRPTGPVVEPSPADDEPEPVEMFVPDPIAAAPQGVPISSPMTGIWYDAPNPGAAPFVKVGDSVTAGQVVGLIEAMKVFNEITATVNGFVVRIEAANGRLVQPGEPLLFIA